MKKTLLVSIFFLGVYNSSFGQSIPGTIRTEYLQLFFGGRNGTSITQDVTKGCAVFLIEIGNSIIEKDCESSRTLLNVKLIADEPTKYFANGWSKRFSGYDLDNPNYGPDGSIILTDFFTISLKDNKYEILHETVGLDVALATRFFNI